MYNQIQLCRDLIVPYIQKNKEQRWLISLCGFPSTGKSTIAKLLRKKFGEDDTIILDEACYLISRKERFKKKLSGCSLEAIDLQKYKSQVRKLMRSEIVNIDRQYNHETGELIQNKIRVTLENKKIFILDGPRSCCNIFSGSFRLVLFFIPTSISEWFFFTMNRDIIERHYVEENSITNSYQSIQDLKDIFNLSKDIIDFTIYTEFKKRGDSFEILYNHHEGAVWPNFLKYSVFNGG